MKSLNILVICLLAVLLVAQTSVAQDRKSGLTGATFLKVGVGARNVALGTAVTALSGDVNQMFYNPAGIALKDEMLQASFTYNKWIADIGHNSAAVSYNIRDVGTIGFGFITFGLSGIEAARDIPVDPGLVQYQTDPNTSSTYDYRDIAYQVTFSRYVMDKLALGITLKGISQTIDGVGANAFAVDFGSVYHVGVLDWTIAARFNNLGSDLKFYDIAAPLPLQFSIGTALSPYKYDKFNYSGTSETPGTGIPAVNTTIEGLSAGAGVRTTMGAYQIGVDYSYTQMDILKAAHRFTLNLGWK